jgi:aminopeptidase YwaD
MRMKPYLFPLAALLLVAGLDAPAAVADKPGPGEDPAVLAAAEFITSEGLLELVAQLARPEWQGRLPGTPGYDAAARAMADRFAELGLEPGGDDGYLQHYSTESNRILDGSELAYEQSDGTMRACALDRDYLFRGFTGSGDVRAPVVFCGYGISRPDLGYDDYNGVDVQGKVVLVFKQPPTWQPDNGSWGDSHLPRPKALTARAKGAVAVIMVTRPLNGQFLQPIASVLHGPGEHPADIPQIHVTLEVANDLVKGLGLGLAALQARIDEHREPFSRPLERQVHLRVKADYEPEALTMNVVGVLPGSDPEMADQCLVVGAHLDHVGAQGEDVIFVGANDNASGSAAVVAMAEAFVKGGLKPRRPVAFVLFSGEESGLTGSRFYAQEPALPLENAVAMINLDCVAHGDSIQAWGGATAPRLWELAYEFDRRARKLMKARTGRGGGADAHPFHELGLPTLYFASSFSYTHLHSTSDKVETLNGEMFAELTRVAFRTAAAVAGGKYEREELVP